MEMFARYDGWWSEDSKILMAASAPIASGPSL
jgi:hypothetical protein